MPCQVNLSGLDLNVRIEWKIPQFFKINKTINSPSFEIFNCRCYLHIQPKRLGFVCMGLSKVTGSEIRCESIMGIKKSDGSETRTKKEFLLMDFIRTDSLNIISVQDLSKSRDIMAPGGCLTVFCTVRLTEVISEPVGNILNLSPRGIKRKKSADVLSPGTSFQEEGITTLGDSVVNEALSVLTGNFKDMYLKKRFADVTIKVGNKEFLAHKVILCARTEVFAAMFEYDMSEKRSGVVEITDCDPESFEDFLIFLYTADVKIVSSRNVVGLYKTSDKYGCKELIKVCVWCMVQELSKDTFFVYFSLAVMYNESDLLTAVTNFFIKNAKTILPMPKWISLLEEHPSLCNELLMKFANAVKLL